MKIHHFNSATIRPALQPLVDGLGSIANPKPVVCHCLVIETDDGLILVDSGIGLHALANPRTWLGSVFIHANRPRLDPEETAIRQLARLGYAACDVRHIVLTHLDLDHAGGIADFPDATVHVSSPEFRGATAPTTPAERLRYRPVLWSRRPRWAVHELTGGERWFGFQAVGDANGLPPQVRLIPLFGHSRGHVGVAVRTGQRWLLHAGDAYLNHRDIDATGRRPGGLRLVGAAQGTVYRRTQQRLRNLMREHAEDVTIFCAHDRDELMRMQRASGDS